MIINFKINSFISKSKLLLIGTFLILLSIPRISSGQAPPLGTTSSFALFTAVGAINGVGTTSVTGDVGTDAGAFTGFPPGIISGQTHIADATSAQAAIDVDAAYNYLTSVTCGSTIGTTLGSNQVLTANIYCLPAASNLIGNLILDGQGNPNALFIIKINGALTTSVFSNIVLINSADAANIYWQINGLFSLGDNSVFIGTVVSDGAINLLDGSSLEGRGLSRAGAISLSNNSVSLTPNETSLPTELLSFNSVCKDQKVILEWSTATETNSDYYLIERSANAINWVTIGKAAGAGNSSSIKNYSFTDEEPLSEASYYRLKQTDHDLKFKYSPIISFKGCKENLPELLVYPNPGNGEINLLFTNDKGLFNSVSIYNSLGEKMYKSEIYQSAINLSGSKPGIYFIYFNLKSSIIVQKLVIN